MPSNEIEQIIMVIGNNVELLSTKKFTEEEKKQLSFDNFSFTEGIESIISKKDFYDIMLNGRLFCSVNKNFVSTVYYKNDEKVGE